MNIKEIKKNYEVATKYVIGTMVEEGVQVTTAYSVDNDNMMVTLTSSITGANKEPVNLIYTINYGVESKAISVAAIARHILGDSFGASNIIYEPIYIDENFLNNMKLGISSAIENNENIIASLAAAQESASADTNEATDAAEADTEAHE